MKSDWFKAKKMILYSAHFIAFDIHIVFCSNNQWPQQNTFYIPNFENWMMKNVLSQILNEKQWIEKITTFKINVHLEEDCMSSESTTILMILKRSGFNLKHVFSFTFSHEHIQVYSSWSFWLEKLLSGIYQIYTGNQILCCKSYVWTSVCSEACRLVTVIH